MGDGPARENNNCEANILTMIFSHTFFSSHFWGCLCLKKLFKPFSSSDFANLWLFDNKDLT